MNEKRSLLECIRESCTNGELPESFSLPKEQTDPNAIQWADGALDGVCMYHMGISKISDEGRTLLADAFSALPDLAAAEAKMLALFAQNSPLSAIDEIQNHVFSHTDTLDPEHVYSFADHCLNSADRNLVKLGLLLMEIFKNPDEAVKENIRILGLSDEFTLFTLFNMKTWPDSNEEIFALAKKVHGWGRIHAVESLEPETQEIRDWLLAEGIRNEVVPDYSALDVYQKTGITALLKAPVTDTQLGYITAVLRSMFDEGPVKGISALPEEEASKMIGSLIKQAETHALTIPLCKLLLTISGDSRFSAYAEQCSRLLNSQASRALIEQALETGEGIELAQTVGIPYQEKVFTFMKAHFDEGYDRCGVLLPDPAYREPVIDLFRKSLPLQDMIGEPTNESRFLGKNMQYYRLLALIQKLEAYPLCGTDLVAASLQMPLVQCRTRAISVAGAWCKARNCGLSELSAELYQAVMHLRSAEVNDNVIKLMDENGF